MLLIGCYYKCYVLGGTNGVIVVVSIGVTKGFTKCVRCSVQVFTMDVIAGVCCRSYYIIQVLGVRFLL